MSQVVGPSDVVMFHHLGKQPNDGTQGEGRAGGCPLGLSNNIHMHYLVVKRDDTPWQLVMSTCLAGICFPPLQIVYLACKYFRLPVN